MTTRRLLPFVLPLFAATCDAPRTTTTAPEDPPVSVSPAGTDATPRPSDAPASTAAAARTDDDAAPSEAPAAKVADADVFASLQPMFRASFQGGWISILRSASDQATLERLAELTPSGDDRLWAGHRSIPAEVRDAGPIWIVSTTGVVKHESFARLRADYQGFHVEYRRRTDKGPGFAMSKAPAGDAKLRTGTNAKAIKRSHPMAERLRSLLAREGVDGAVLRRLSQYTLQITPGRFPAADRIVSVSAVDPTEVEYGGDHCAVFTLGSDDVVGQVLVANGDPTLVAGLVDLDDDGYDEVLTTMSGYETASEDVYHLTDAAVAQVNLWSHDE